MVFSAGLAAPRLGSPCFATPIERVCPAALPRYAGYVGAWIDRGPAMPRSGPDAGHGGVPEGRDPRGEPHPSGWRVRPGPDGRGAPPSPRPRWFGPGFLIFFLLLLLLNIVLTSTVHTQPARVWIPYSPTFLNQFNAGNISSISSKGTTIKGNFRAAVRYPANSTATSTKLFVTELPEFVNNSQLLALLQSKGVVVNATSPSTGTSVFVTLLLSFGPALLLVLLLVPLANDVNLDHLAATTPGMVGADLANVINEAALTAARRGHDAVTMADLHDALEKLVLGTERRILLSPEERRRTAYHEAGHAIIGMLTAGADPVRKVSIIPRGIALGVTLSAPEADRFSYDRRYLLGKIQVALGGRVAEELVFNDITTGAQNDIKHATELARNMVGLWGMSDVIGPVTVITEDRQLPLPGASDISPVTQQLVDEKVRHLIENAHKEVTQLMSANRSKLDALAQALLEHETLAQDEAYAAAGIEPPRALVGLDASARRGADSLGSARLPG